MIIRCGWCGSKMGEKAPYGGLNEKFDKMITDGICPDCLGKNFPHIAEKLANAGLLEKGKDDA